MALTFTERLRTPLGRHKLVIYDITHDGSETSIDASDLNLNRVVTAINVASTVPLSATSAAYADLTTNNGNSLVMTALSSSAVTTIWAVGY